MAATKYGEKRVRRMANGETTQRSELDADSVTRVLREHAAATLHNEAEVTLILDGMELRREGADSQEHLMRVKALDGGLMNGYRSFNVLGLGEGEARLLARLGGWEPRANRPPGKLILSRGLRRLLDRLATDAILQDHLDEFGDLPPFVKRILARSSRSLLEH